MLPSGVTALVAHERSLYQVCSPTVAFVALSSMLVPVVGSQDRLLW